MRVPLAGGTQETLLSEVGPVLLPFFTTRDACAALRLVCREFPAAAKGAPVGGQGDSDQGQHCGVARMFSARARRQCVPLGRSLSQ